MLKIIHILVVSKMIKEVDKAFLGGVTAEFMRVDGIMENSPEKESLQVLQE